MITVLMAAMAFSVIILLLAALIVGAEKKLVRRGTAMITVNNDDSKALTVEPGRSLLATLAGENIFLSSACGGKGTCGTCKCRVESGGGEILPIEQNYVNRKMEREGWRLACQVKVREDMAIRVPDEVFSVKRYACRVVSNENVATYIKEFVLALPPGEKLDFEPGAYIQIDVPEYEIHFGSDIDIAEKFHADWKKLGLTGIRAKNRSVINRAYSMANHPAEGSIIKLNVRIATPPWDPARKAFRELPPGMASSYIFKCKPGDEVMVSGPYGDFAVQETDREMIFIGGGAGMAPLRSQIFHQFHTLKTKRKASYWYGARSLRELFYEKEFRDIEKEHNNFRFHVALSEPMAEDNWKGFRGFIHQVLYENYLREHPAPEDIEYYVCGPPFMLDAVKKMLFDLGVEDEMVRYDDFGG
ncbi:MAG: NADH:ubiquinone reductase (Na(+)-transporting) subunit F [Thermodesulfobacteriota bacterium]